MTARAQLGLWKTVILATCMCSSVGYAGDSAPFSLAAAITVPGWGGAGPAPCGTNPDYLNPVLVFGFAPSKQLTPTATIQPCPITSLNDPAYLTFDNRGELFVSNRAGNNAGNTVSRFVFDRNGNPIENGVITSSDLVNPHGLAFSSRGELFIGNYQDGRIVRFKFTPRGEAVPNGVIQTNHDGGMGLAFSKAGELFVTASGNTVFRYLFDPATGEATPNGAFLVPEGGALHGLAFNHRGELFVVEPNKSRVYRFQFDPAGNAIYNGFFNAPLVPIGLAFSPTGDLFVGSHGTGGISRFQFDAAGYPHEVEFIPTRQLGGLAVYPAAL